MRKIILGLFTVFALSISSCDDVIDIEQPGTLLAENAFTNVADLESGVLGVMNGLDNTQQILVNAIFTDELAIGQDSGGQNINIYSLNLDPNNFLAAGIWNTNYITLNQLNKVLLAMESVPVESGEQTRANNVKGQLLAMRAYLHFDLLTYFSPDYSDDAAPGVIILAGENAIPSVSDQLARSTTGETFAAIEADLAMAQSLLSDQSNRAFISKDFISALRARMAAYRGNFSQIDALVNPLLARYPISNQAQFTSMWDDVDDTEIIFEMERAVNDTYNNQGTGGFGWVGSLFAFVNSTLAGSPYMEMSRSLFNQLDAVPGDVRRSTYVDGTSLIDPNYATDPAQDKNPNDIIVISKYPGHSGQPLMNDLKIFRSAEMLLLKAEAAADASRFGDVATLIKQLRDARFGSAQPLPSITNQQGAFAAILAERRLELALEGHRWVDIKRLGQRAGVTIDRDPVDCTKYSACSLSNTDFRFTLPIPLGQIDVNTNLAQNPGY